MRGIVDTAMTLLSNREVESGELSMDDGDFIKWKTERETVEF